MYGIVVPSKIKKKKKKTLTHSTSASFKPRCQHLRLKLELEMWWGHTAICWLEWLRLSLEPLCPLEFPLVLSRLVFLSTVHKKWYKAKEEVWWKKKTKQRTSATSCYSTYSTCVSIHSWLWRLMYKKARSLWAACNSQYDFYNGHNGGQDHLLLAGGEVCILLQLKRKTSRCLQRAVMWLWEWWIHGEWVSQAGGSILLSGAGGGSVIEVN